MDVTLLFLPWNSLKVLFMSIMVSLRSSLLIFMLSSFGSGYFFKGA